MNLECVHFTRWTPQRTSPEGVEDAGDEVAVHRANDLLLDSTRLGNGRTGEAVQTLCQQHGASLEACGNGILLSASVDFARVQTNFLGESCVFAFADFAGRLHIVLPLGEDMRAACYKRLSASGRRHAVASPSYPPPPVHPPCNPPPSLLLASPPLDTQA